MKRDFDLIRNVLRDVEKHPALTPIGGFQYDGYDDNIIIEHVELLIESGLLQGKVSRYLGGGGSVYVGRLTWAGHDFLDAMKDDTIWKKAQESVLKPAISGSFEVLLEWLKWQAKIKLGMPTT